MSGHSHWHQIRFKKGIEDAKRSKVFSKLSKEISIAARDGGGDLVFNPTLRSIVDKAKLANMPADSIDKAIKKGTGELEGVSYEAFIIEAYGPNGTALMIDGITDNKNRSLNEIKLIITQHGGKVVNEGAIKWMFEKKGVIVITDLKGKSKDDIEMISIDAGADDFNWEEESLYVYTKPEELEKTRKALEEKGLKSDSAELEWVSKEVIEADDATREKNQRLFEALDEHDDVSNVYSNI
jgi:YebC/PmpR family DNA-binding regulatory protein